MQKICAISGRKGVGKDTCYKFLHRLLTRGDIDPEITKEVRQFNFADSLKSMAIDILGCPREYVYGTDDQKNLPIPHLLWENFPIPAYEKVDRSVFLGYPNNMPRTDAHVSSSPTISIYTPTPLTWEAYNDIIDYIPIAKDGSPGMPMPTDVLNTIVTSIHYGETLTPKTGPMTSREVLQYYGSDIFRKQYPNVWVDVCIRSIQKSDCKLAVITDTRFPNEVEAVRGAGGKTIRLTRTVFPEDNHVSEVSLDEDKYDWGNFDEVIDNKCYGIYSQSMALYMILRHWGWVPRLQSDLVQDIARQVQKESFQS